MMNAPSHALEAMTGKALRTSIEHEAAAPASTDPMMTPEPFIEAALVAPVLPHDPSHFEQIASALAAKGLPVIPLRPMTKVAVLPNWPELATTESKVIAEWGETYPQGNVACVAKLEPGGFWFLEVDAKDYHKEIQKQTGEKMPLTMAVSSRKGEGRGHFYFKHTPASLAMGNIEGKDADGKETWSARADNKYVVGPGSIHPITLRPYQVIVDAPIADAPDWLVEWLLKNKHVAVSEDKERVNASPDGPPIPRGSHDNTLFKIACSLRNSGLGQEEITDLLIKVCEKRCVGYGADYVDMCEKKAASACKYPVGEARFAYVGSSVRAAETAAANAEPELQFEITPYPKFPEWVMHGTSIYEGLVKPVCDVNSRYPEFMFMPAYVTLLNYLHGKVSVKGKNIVPSLFLVMIGRKGRVIKSSSAQDAIKYLEMAGIVTEGAATASGKTMLFRPGSPEGLGTLMMQKQCKNPLLFYDELSALVGKVGIESSGLASSLLTLYESGYFANQTKVRKEQYAFPAGCYCASLIACTTETDFSEQWAQLITNRRGMDERFYFLYQPETLKPLTPYKHVDTLNGAVLTQQQIAEAVTQGTYEITNPLPFEANINELGNRTEIRAEKFALAFAVDLGKKEIDDECVQRGLALAKYEKDVKRYLGGADESVDKLAAAQNKFCRMLQRQPQGTMTMFAAERGMNYNRYSTETWYRIVNGLERSKRIQVTPGARKDSTKIRLLELVEFEG